MNTFESAFEAAQLLAAEYDRLDTRIGSMVVAEDHDSSWTADDTAALDKAIERRAELSETLKTAFKGIEFEYRKAWHAYLAEMANRLRALSESNDGDRFAAGAVLLHWDRWVKGERDADSPKAFANGLPLLATHRKLIDDLLRAGR